MKNKSSNENLANKKSRILYVVFIDAKSFPEIGVVKYSLIQSSDYVHSNSLVCIDDDEPYSVKGEEVFFEDKRYARLNKWKIRIKHLSEFHTFDRQLAYFLRQGLRLAYQQGAKDKFSRLYRVLMKEEP